MMNREDFLKELQSHIAMLEEAEQQDILTEYAQHIDLLMRDGRSEDEAIRDFGPVDELAAQILEAYHIDPAYGSRAASPADPPQPRRRFSLSGLWHRLVSGCRGFCGQVRSFFVRTGERCRARAAEKAAARLSRKASSSGLTQAGQTGKRFALGARQAGRRALWLLWNCCLGLGLLPLVLLSLAALVLLGLLLVLLTRSLPLFGIFLMTLGGLLSCAALAGLFVTWIWHWKRALPGGNGPIPESEASHEN